MGRGRLEEAESAFNTAVGVAKKVYGPDGEQTLVIRNSLATVLRKAAILRKRFRYINRYIIIEIRQICDSFFQGYI